VGFTLFGKVEVEYTAVDLGYEHGRYEIPHPERREFDVAQVEVADDTR